MGTPHSIHVRPIHVREVQYVVLVAQRKKIIRIDFIGGCERWEQEGGENCEHNSNPLTLLRHSVLMFIPRSNMVFSQTKFNWISLGRPRSEYETFVQ